MIRFLTIWIVCVFAAGQALAERLVLTEDAMAAFDAQALLELSVPLPDTEKAIVRQYMAETFPEAADGLYAKGWLAQRSADPDSAEAFYLAAVKLDPKHRYAAASAAGYEEKERKKRRLLKAGAFEKHLTSFHAQRYYEFLQETKSDRSALRYAKKLLKKPEHADVGRFLMGRERELAGDLPGAIAAVAPCLDDPNSRFPCVRNWALYTIDHARQGGASDRDLYGALAPVIDYGRTHSRARVLGYVADRLYGFNNRDGRAMRLYADAWDLQPTAHFATRIFDMTWRSNARRAIRFLETAESELPRNWALHRTLMRAYFEYAGELDEAEDAGHRMQQLAILPDHKAQAVAYMSQFYSFSARYGEARRLLRRAMNDPFYGADHAERLRRELVRAAKYASNFELMNETLWDGQSWDNTFESWVASERVTAIRAFNAQSSRETMLSQNPIYRVWAGRIGPAAKLVLAVEGGAADLSADTQAALDTAASVLKDYDNPAYGLVIEGQSSPGDADQEAELSRGLTEKVADYFVEHHGIDRARLKTLVRPALAVPAPSETPEAATSREVEVRLFGRNRPPATVRAGNTESKSVAFSRDGRYAAIGTDPIQLWDIEAGLKIADLGSGGWQRRFSPNGRYVAALSKWSDDNNRTDTALYVYDVVTGETVHQYRTPFGLTDFAWSPDSAYVAIGGWSDVRVLDVLTGRTHSYAKTYGRAKGVRMHWTQDGKHILHGEAGVQFITVRDAFTLKKVGTLDLDYGPTAMGQSRDGRWIYCIDGNGSMKVWNAEDLSFKHSIRVPFLTRIVADHATEPKVLIQRSDKVMDINVALINLATGDMEARSSLKTEGFAGWTADGSSILASDGKTINWLSPADFSVKRQLSGSSTRPVKAEYNAADGRLLVQDSAGVSVWALPEGRIVERYSTVSEVPFEKLDEAGRRWVGLDAEGFLLELNLDEKRVKRTVNAEIVGDAADLKLTRDFVVAANVTEGADRQHYVNISVFARSNLGIVNKFSFPVADKPLKRGMTHFGYLEDWDVSDHFSALTVATRWMDGFGTGKWDKSTFVRVFDLETGARLHSQRRDKSFDKISFDVGDAPIVEITEGSTYWRQIDFTTGAETTSGQFGKFGNQIDLGDGETLEWSSNFIRRGERVLPSRSMIKTVTLLGDEQALLVYTRDNEVHLVDMQSLQTQAVLSDSGAGQWIVYTPEGYYAASETGVEGLYWSYFGYVEPFAQGRRSYERPDVIGERLARLLRAEN